MAPVQAAGERFAPVVAAPEEKAGVHVPDEPGVPPAVRFLQKGDGSEAAEAMSSMEKIPAKRIGEAGSPSGFPGAAASSGALAACEPDETAGPREAGTTPRSIAGMYRVTPARRRGNRDTRYDAETEAAAGKESRRPGRPRPFFRDGAEKRQSAGCRWPGGGAGRREEDDQGFFSRR